MQVSVVMAAFNGEAYLQEAVNSILAQTYTDFEFIIVNDGSTDGTRSILDAISDSRVQIYHLEQNRGLARALNYGIRRAKNEWIVRQDADDISLPTRIEEQVRHIESHPDVVAVSSMVDFLHADEASKGTEPRWVNTLATRDQIREHRFISAPVIHGSVTFSKKAFDDIGGYDRRYKIGQDFDLWIRLLNIGPIDKVPSTLYLYRVDAKSLCHKNEDDTCIENLKICSRQIRKMLQARLQRRPYFAIVGPRKACKYYSSFVCPGSRIQVLRFVYKDVINSLPSLYSSYRAGKIHGIIVLDGSESDEVLSYLQNKGMKQNYNLFRAWNIFS